jgi:hypothetical protein
MTACGCTSPITASVLSERIMRSLSTYDRGGGAILWSIAADSMSCWAGATALSRRPRLDLVEEFDPDLLDLGIDVAFSVLYRSFPTLVHNIGCEFRSLLFLHLLVGPKMTHTAIISSTTSSAIRKYNQFFFQKVITGISGAGKLEDEGTGNVDVWVRIVVWDDESRASSIKPNPKNRNERDMVISFLPSSHLLTNFSKVCLGDLQDLYRMEDIWERSGLAVQRKVELGIKRMDTATMNGSRWSCLCPQGQNHRANCLQTIHPQAPIWLADAEISSSKFVYVKLHGSGVATCGIFIVYGSDQQNRLFFAEINEKWKKRLYEINDWTIALKNRRGKTTVKVIFNT